MFFDDPGSSYTILGIIGLLGFILGGVAFHYTIGRWQARKTQQAARRDVEKARLAERERLRAIYNLISNLTATLIYNRVLDLALDLSANVLSTPEGATDRLVSAVFLFSKAEGGQTRLTVGSARRFANPDMRITLPGASGVVGKVIEGGEPTLCKDVAQDPELSRFLALRACKVAYCLPLRTGLDVYGMLLFAHPDPAFFGTSQRDVLDIVTQQAVIAMQNARLYHDLEQEKERMLEIQEEARKKLARDLHDGPTQSVAAIAMRVNFTRRMMERDIKSAMDELIKIEELARRTTKEIRHMLFTMRPLVLESQGLQAALEAMAEKMRDTYDQNVIISVDEKVIPELEIGKQTVIFFIAEEAVNNARKYAQAAHIWVRLKDIGNGLTVLEVQDDGVGFNVESVTSSYDHRGSLGMVNMRERAELVNGVLKIESAEGKGAMVRVLIPLTEDAAERIRRGLR